MWSGWSVRCVRPPSVHGGRGAPSGVAGFRTIAEAMMPSIEITAPTRNAECTPDAVARAVASAAVAAPATSPFVAAAVAPRVSRVTNSAVPAAPASCWAVPRTALPCEYRRGGSPPSAAVNSGVKVSARPRLSTMCATRTNVTLVSAVTVESAQSTALMMTDPGMSSMRGPCRS